MIPIILAVTISLSSPPPSLNYQQESEVDVTLTCSSCGDSYLRAVFFKDGKTSYFGYTKDASTTWVNTTSDKTLYFPVLKTDLVEGSWSGKLYFKPDYESTCFEGAGDYRFKVGRYTSANSSASWSDSYPITLVAPAPTSTPNPPTSTSSPSNTPKPTPTPKPPTPSSTPKPTLIPTLKTTSTLIPTTQVLSASTSSSSLTPIQSHLVISTPVPLFTAQALPAGIKRPSSPLPLTLIISGLVVFGYLVYRVY